MLPFELSVNLPAKTKKGKAETVKVVCFAVDVVRGRETKVKFFVYADSFRWVYSEMCSMTEGQLKNCQ